MVRSPGGLLLPKGIFDGVSGELPVESISQTVCTNDHGTKTGVPPGISAGREEPVSKHQIRSGNGRWAARRGVGWLNPRRETKSQGKNGDRERGIRETVTTRRKFVARKRRRPGRAERRLLRKRETRNQARARRREIKVAAHSVQTMAVNGTHGVGQALDVLRVYDRLGCDFIGLQETHRSRHSAFTEGGYPVYCSGEYVRMYVCMVIAYSRVWINRVRLPILLVVRTEKMNIPLSPYVPEKFGLARRVQPSRPASACSFSLLQTESGAYLRDSSRVPRRRPFINIKPPYAIGSVPSLSGHAIAYRWRSLPRVRRHRASKPQGSSEQVLPSQVTLDQLICASLSPTHYWYEVGMLKVPAMRWREWWEEIERWSRTGCEDLHHACCTPTEVYQ